MIACGAAGDSEGAVRAADPHAATKGSSANQTRNCAEQSNHRALRDSVR